MLFEKKETLHSWSYKNAISKHLYYIVMIVKVLLNRQKLLKRTVLMPDKTEIYLIRIK